MGDDILCIADRSKDVLRVSLPGSRSMGQATHLNELEKRAGTEFLQNQKGALADIGRILAAFCETGDQAAINWNGSRGNTRTRL